MKVFWLKKPAEERDIPMYRGHKEPKNIYKFNISNTVPFNYLVITNPNDSSSICTILNLQFDTTDKNNTKIYMGEDLVIDKSSKIKQADSLQISSPISNEIEDSLTELDTVIVPTNLLSNHYTILLPGGSLILKTENNISEADLVFDLTTVEL